MPIAKGLRNRRLLVIDHREVKYMYSLDEIISGKAKDTTYCTYRYKKWKQIRGK